MYSAIAAEISSLTRYYDGVVQWMRQPDDDGFLLDRIDAQRKEDIGERESFDLREETNSRTAVLLNATLNCVSDIEELLVRLKEKLSRTSRVIAVLHNPYYSFAYRIAAHRGIKGGGEVATFITYADLRNLARLTGFEIVRIRPSIYVPFSLFGIGNIVNRWMPLVPLVRHSGLVAVVVLRPLINDDRRPSVSVIVPARNERGNIRQVIERLPDFQAPTEIILVEGHSSDGTWEEIENIVKEGKRGASLVALQQSGIGKNDAVRLATERAQNDVVVILDADLSVPPERLLSFYDAYRRGTADFVNGTRLVYPMERAAMRFLNKIANVFFAKALSVVLDVRITDTLCGTKLLARHDLQRIERWRADFGKGDPFGDFDLLFPAAVLGLGVVDVPIRYRARTYGTTNIRRFRDGLRLIAMTASAVAKITSGRVPPRE